MRTVTIHNGEELPVIGLGTWLMGGASQPKPRQDAKALNALSVALKLGYRHIDTAELYARGHTEELVGQAIRAHNRADLFLTTKVRPPNLRYQDVWDSLEGSLDRLGVDQIDLYLIHWPQSGVPLENTFKALNEAVAAGKIRHLGVSNFTLPLLREAQVLSKTPIVTNQVPYSIATRDYARNGVLEYCQQNGIVFTAYSPVEEGRLTDNGLLKKIADAHEATPFQVALAWLVQQPMVITIPMSQNPEHLAQNLAAAEIALSPVEMEAINQLA
jgi:diketogulonate reductase-like aldo/keto reductase